MASNLLKKKTGVFSLARYKKSFYQENNEDDPDHILLLAVKVMWFQN